MTTRAAIYARVSSADQRDRQTIESQLRVLPAFVASQGWELVETYVDDGRSARTGKLDKREAFARLARDAEAKRFDVLVVVNVDRLTRTEDMAERAAILGPFQRAGIRIVTPSSGPLDMRTFLGELYVTFDALRAAEENRVRGERVKAGQLTAITRGRKPRGRGPWWLDYDRERGVWSPNPERAPLAVEAFARVADGASCREIADDFHRRGVRRLRGEWTGARVLEMIRSRAAVGEWLADKRRKLTIAVPPVVDEDLWHRAQGQLAINGRRGLRKTRHAYLLEGLAVCGECGSPMGIRSGHLERRKGKGAGTPPAYRCLGKRYVRLGDAPCTAPLVRIDEADARAWEAIRRELEDPGLAAEIAHEIDGRAGDHDRWRADAAGHRAHLARLDEVEAAILQRFERGLIGEAGLDRELQRLAGKRASLRAQIATAEQAQTATALARERLDDATRTIEGLRGKLDAADFATRRALVEGLIPRGGVVFVGEEMRLTLLVQRPAAPDQATAASCCDGHERRGSDCLRIRVVA